MTIRGVISLMMKPKPPPVFVEAKVGTTTASSTVVPALTSVQDGDFLVAFVALSAPSGVPATVASAPPGFTERSAGPNAASVWTKAANGESGTYTFTSSAGGGTNAYILVYRRASGFNRVGNWNSSGNGASQTALSVNPNRQGVLLANFKLNQQNRTVSSPPAGMTQRAFANNGPCQACYELNPSLPGASGNKTLVWNAGTTFDFNANILLQVT